MRLSSLILSNEERDLIAVEQTRLTFALRSLLDGKLRIETLELSTPRL